VYSDRYIRNTALYGAASWILRKVDHKFLENFEIRCWRRTEKISWTDRVGNEEIIHWIKEERSYIKKIIKADWIGPVLRRYRLLKHVILGKIEGGLKVTERRKSRSKQLLDDRKETREY
jgi:hypothetical protein